MHPGIWDGLAGILEDETAFGLAPKGRERFEI